MYNKKGKIVSKKKSMMARKNMRGGSGSLNIEQYERYLHQVQSGYYKNYTLQHNFEAFRLYVNNKNMFTDSIRRKYKIFNGDRYNISISGKSRILEQKFNRSKDIYNGHYIWYTENSYYYFYLDYIDEEDKWYWILRHDKSLKSINDKEKYIQNNITPIPLKSSDIVAYKQIEDLHYPLPLYKNTEWTFNQTSGKPIVSKLYMY